MRELPDFENLAVQFSLYNYTEVKLTVKLTPLGGTHLKRDHPIFSLLYYFKCDSHDACSAPASLF